MKSKRQLKLEIKLRQTAFDFYANEREAMQVKQQSSSQPKTPKPLIIQSTVNTTCVSCDIGTHEHCLGKCDCWCKGMLTGR